ncbi:hypothetical protein EI427_19835 [Flammeovirga pectinis]|uniref:Uncharacterized protein n=1 Tax=Flammeovirga pectinis TaxID=2494373 RepID=A0A3Q9FRM5_9BACT|nr:hypothetical protein [Flammeovirga pectinis]AZQ64379.1 hypothetical protein EI427_19835 [Flammeovirga pectinis]
MKIKTDRLCSLLITSALFGTNIELSEENKTSVCIESPIPQHNLKTYKELQEVIRGISITDLMTGKSILEAPISTKIDLSFISSGNYVLTVHIKGTDISRKLSIIQQGQYDIVRA